METAFLLATFLYPEKIGTTPLAMLWVLPLVASIAIVYKATKVDTIELRPFAKETFVLFGSIVVFLGVAAIVLCLIAWFVNDRLPAMLG
ncbi:MAG: hypothetical protein IIC50_11545 [Planctomycetes bacterium]|nr:hypothetical protein [Planctomycetota bacterium]